MGTEFAMLHLPLFTYFSSTFISGMFSGKGEFIISYPLLKTHHPFFLYCQYGYVS